MLWKEVQDQFPNKWVLLEVVKAHTLEGNRYIEEVVVVDRFDDSTTAMRQYSELHKRSPHREYCFFHTSRPNLIARERFIGVRGPR